MHVLILGCGPAGLLAAHAATQTGSDPVILSRKEKSALSGTQFLHEAIPGLTDGEPDGTIRYVVRGDPAEYARKVYGAPEMSPSVSFNDVYDGKEQHAWSLAKAYNALWSRYENRIVHAERIDSHTIERELEHGGWDLVLSSLPAPAICKNPSHAFLSTDVWVSDTAIEDVAEGTVVYDGTKDRGWYRLSRLWGKEATEWGVNKPPLPGIKSVSKPRQTTCGCWLPQVARLGRYGTWTKGVLTHHAYGDALEALRVRHQEMMAGEWLE